MYYSEGEAEKAEQDEVGVWYRLQPLDASEVTVQALNKNTWTEEKSLSVGYIR